MPQYEYQTIDPGGKIIKGAAAAADIPAAATWLRGRGWSIIDIKASMAVEAAVPGGTTGTSAAPDSGTDFLLYFSRVKRADVILLFEQLAALFAGGLSVVEALSVLEEQANKRRLRYILGEIRRMVEAGQPLSEAMESFPRVFPPLATSLIKTGEASGLLDNALERVAAHLKEQIALRRQVIAAFVYPSVVVATTIGVVFFMIGYVIPRITPFIRLAGGQLPWNTQLLIDAGEYFQANIADIGLGLAGFIVAFVAFYNLPATRRFIDRYKIVLPVFGGVFQCAIVLHFAKTLNLLLASGLPITEALRATRDTFGNLAVRKALDDMVTAVLSGSSLYEPVKKSGVLFPPLVATMIKVGEETGNVDGSLQTVAGIYGNLLQAKIQSMIAVIEPVLIFIIAGLVGFVAWGMIAGIMAGYGA